MNAVLLLKSRDALGPNRYTDLVIWQVPVPLAGSAHLFMYRLALVVDEVCVLRYDNESGKGDHKHLSQDEVPLRLHHAGSARRRLLGRCRPTVRPL